MAPQLSSISGIASSNNPKTLSNRMDTRASFINDLRLILEWRKSEQGSAEGDCDRLKDLINKISAGGDKVPSEMIDDYLDNARYALLVALEVKVLEYAFRAVAAERYQTPISLLSKAILEQ